MNIEEIQQDSVENVFCKEFERLQRFPMSDELTKCMVTMFLSDITKPIPEIEKEFLFQVIRKRIDVCFTFKLSDWRLITFLMMLSQSPGKAVMYFTYLQYWLKKNNINEITFEIFCDRIFPMGFPLDKDLDKLWNKQKIESGNLLDHQKGLKSIQFV